jgi:hypothetical protein
VNISPSIGNIFLPLLRDNLISVLIGVCLGWLGRTLVKAIRYRYANHFWKPFVTGDLQVVVGRFFEFASFEQSGFLGVGEAIGLTELRAYFRKLGLRDLSISYADELTGDALKTNLILIGGPDANSVSKEVLSKIQTAIRFGNPSTHNIALHDTLTNKYFVPNLQKDSQEKINTDYCGIIRTPNPFTPDKRLLLIAGSFGYGTWAGIRFVTSEQFVKNKVVSKNKPIECLIEVDIVRRTPQDIRPIFLREIDKTREANRISPIKIDIP